MLNRPATGATPRVLERRLLLGAAFVGALGLSTVHLSLYQGAPWVPVLAGTAALLSFLIPHVLLARSRRSVDEFLLPLAAALTGVSLVTLYRLHPMYLLRQAAWVALGVAVLLVVLPTMSTLWWARRYRYLCGAAALMLLILTIAAGVITLVWPTPTLVVLAILFAVQIGCADDATEAWWGSEEHGQLC